MTQTDKARKVLPELKAMVGSDLMKARHYLKQGVQIAIVAEDKKASEQLAAFYIELDDLVERYESHYRKLVD